MSAVTSVTDTDSLADGSQSWSVNSLVGYLVATSLGAATVLANTQTLLKLNASFFPPLPVGTPYTLTAPLGAGGLATESYTLDGSLT